MVVLFVELNAVQFWWSCGDFKDTFHFYPASLDTNTKSGRNACIMMSDILL